MGKQRKILFAVLSAMFASLIIVTTAYIRIPAPLGYVHIGDSMIYLSASILPGPFGFLSAAIGGALADLLAGYPQWMPATAIIKALNVLPFFLVKLFLKGKAKSDKISSALNILMLIPTTLVTLGGYFIANMLMYGVGAAVGELLPNLLQATASAAVFILLGLSLDSVSFKKRIILGENKTKP